MSRLCLTFSKSNETRYLSHLDLLRLWQRTFRRAKIPVAYSAGHSPHPRLSLASPLAVGIDGRAELLEVFLEGEMKPGEIKSRVNEQLPRGVAVLEVTELGEGPPLAALVRSCDYRVIAEGKGLEQGELEERIGEIMAASEILREKRRGDRLQIYDLRALILELSLGKWEDDRGILFMRLRSDSSGSGRPDEVLAALDLKLEPRLIERLRINLVG